MAYNLDFSPINEWSHSRELIAGPRTTHTADFTAEIKGRAYWGQIYRLFDASAPSLSLGLSRLSYEVVLYTRNSRTGYGQRVACHALPQLRAEVVKAFKGLLSAWVDAGRPSTYEQRRAKLEAQNSAALAASEALEAETTPAPAPAAEALEVAEIAEALEVAQRAEAVADLVKAGREALFALEGVALLQGNREIAAYAVRLGQALAPFAEGAAL